jgi:hypothetical protein
MLLLVLILSFLTTKPPDRRGGYHLSAETILYPLRSSTVALQVLATKLGRSRRTANQLGRKARDD